MAKSRVRPTYRADTGRLEKLAYDRNGDGREDAWTFMDGTRLIRAELDDDFDGRVDRREFYAAGEQGEPSRGSAAIQGLGVLARVELISKTGNVARRETYDRGVLSTAAEDTNDDERADKWEQVRERRARVGRAGHARARHAGPAGGVFTRWRGAARRNRLRWKRAVPPVRAGAVINRTARRPAYTL